MAERPDETGGSAEIGPAPWPVVDRSMINYDVPQPYQSPPMGSTPYAGEQAGLRWSRILLVLAGLMLLIAAVATLVVLVL